MLEELHIFPGLVAPWDPPEGGAGHCRGEGCLGFFTQSDATANQSQKMEGWMDESNVVALEKMALTQQTFVLRQV